MNLDYLNELLKKYSIKEIANKLNIASGTIKRWIELNEIPKNYEFDLLKLSNISIDYSKYSSKEKDQFYTPKETAEECFNIFLKIIYINKLLYFYKKNKFYKFYKIGNFFRKIEIF